MNKFSWIGYNIDTHTGFTFANDSRIQKLYSDLNDICANLELSDFVHVKEIASVVGQITSMTASCGNVTQIMTRYLHLIINSRRSWNSAVFVHDQGKEEVYFWRDNLRTLNGVSFWPAPFCPVQSVVFRCFFYRLWCFYSGFQLSFGKWVNLWHHFELFNYVCLIVNYLPLIIRGLGGI